MDRQSIRCPYCGELLEIGVDPSVRQQEYIEDCQVCCRPMVLRVTVGSRDGREEDDVVVAARREDD